ncbi:MAG: Ig-like domain-containing protein [Gemmatimonadota bacterium]
MIFKRSLALFSGVLIVACTDSNQPLGPELLNEVPQSVLNLPNGADADTLEVGESLQLSATLPKSRGRAAAKATIWSSTDSAVASVSNTGIVTARAAGLTQITAANNLGSVAATIVVAAPVSVVTTPPAPTPPDTAPTATTPPPSSPLPPATTTVELPRVFLDDVLAEARAASPSRTINVGAGSDVQRVLDTARYGDEIVLQAGVTYRGMLELKAKPGSGWITIRSSGSLPAAGTRLRPSDASGLAKLTADLPYEPAIRVQAGAHHYRLVGLEVTAPSTTTWGYTMVELGNGGISSRSDLPSHLVLDRMYIHGTPTLDFQRCIALNSASTAIVDSWISECHARGQDSQAIMGWNGTGPYKIVNNFLEGAGENIMFGGSDPHIAGALPADIEIRRNHFFKPLSWQGVWTAKNSFELKIGVRVLVEGNVFENSWADGQTGFGIVLKSTNQDNTAPWSQTADVTFRYNVVRNVAHGFAMAGHSEANAAVPMSRIYIGHNSVEQVGTSGGRFEGGRVFHFSGVDDLTFDANSGVGSLSGFEMYDTPSQRMVMKNNAVGLSGSRWGAWQFSVVSSNGRGGGSDALAYHAPGAVVRGNLFWGNVPGYLPLDNLFPVDPQVAGFLGFPGNLELSSSSAFRATSPGVDFSALRQHISGVVVTP